MHLPWRYIKNCLKKFLVSFRHRYLFDFYPKESAVNPSNSATLHYFLFSCHSIKLCNTLLLTAVVVLCKTLVLLSHTPAISCLKLCNQFTNWTLLCDSCLNASWQLFTPRVHRGEYPTLIYPCRRAYRKVMMQQQGFVICDVLEVKNLLKLPSLPVLRTATFVNGYSSNTFASCLDP